MFRIVAYSDALQEPWDRLARSAGTVFHTTAIRRILLESFGYRCCYHAVVDSDNRVRALIPLVRGRNLGLRKAGVSLPFVNYVDLCADGEEALLYAREMLPALRGYCGLDYIELRLKDQPAPGDGWQEQLRHFTFSLPLAGGEETVLALSSGSNRNHVRKVYRSGRFDVSFDPAHLDAFYRVYATRMKQLGSPAPDVRFFRRFLEWLPEEAHLLTVLDAATGSVAGGMLLLLSPGDETLYYPYGANLVAYNNYYLNNFMYWEAVRFGIRHGMKRLDLGRSQAGSGTYKYKEQWGARPEQLRYCTYDGTSSPSGLPDPERLRLFVELWKKTPRFITDPLGKRLISYVFP
ncbi:GNAT family N-acetyltransferase [Paenibacillus cymbidii]|uniref:GNAT family N-acetyltransferase n=1 Tax=Paenibacillus cymbidii TaxID=1639034 RepID=UPI0010822F15|nr:GNAT family N-acetyltransferase [Paenibacillus cymbidii]